jgi:hypothetical protein
MDLDVHQEQIDRYDSGGVLIQSVFPNLNRGEREFIKSGILPEEYDRVFNTAEDNKFDEEHCYE